MEATMAVRHWAIGVSAALVLALPTTSMAQTPNPRVTWAEAVEYVLQHGTASSFYGPVAASLGLGNGTVNHRVLSVAGNPKRDFYVTDTAVVLSVTWTSGASRGYTASRNG